MTGTTAGNLREYKLRINQPTMMLNEYLRMNKYKHAKLVSEWAWLLMLELQKAGWRKGLPCMEYCQITIERCCERAVDWDGLYGGVKPLLDALTRCHPKTNKYGLGVIYDDNVKRVKPLTVLPRFDFTGKPYTLITITELPE